MPNPTIPNHWILGPYTCGGKMQLVIAIITFIGRLHQPSHFLRHLERYLPVLPELYLVKLRETRDGYSFHTLTRKFSNWPRGFSATWKGRFTTCTFVLVKVCFTWNLLSTTQGTSTFMTRVVFDFDSSADKQRERFFFSFLVLILLVRRKNARGAADVRRNINH